MKICLVGPDNLAALAPQHGRHAHGAGAVQQVLLARALARRGHEVSMLVADHGQPDGAQWDGIRTLKARSRWLGTWSALERAGADLHYASAGDPRVGAIALYCAYRGKRLALHAGGEGGARAWRYGFGLRQAHAVLVPGVAEQKALARRYGVHARVARPLVQPGPAQARRDIDVLWMGPMRTAARPDRVLSLALRLPQLRVHMAASPLPGDEALFRVMHRMAGHASNLTFHGRLSCHETGALLARAKLLLGSADDGGLPEAHLQAWAWGVPVAALADPGGLIAREGLGVTADTPWKLLDAVRALLEDEAAWRAASARCARFMTRHHGEPRTLRAYLEAFEAAQRPLSPLAPRRGQPLHA